MEISISFSPPISHSSSHSSISRWCTGVLVVVSSFPTFQTSVPTFQTFSGFFPCCPVFVCTKPVLWFNARLGSSIFISCSFPSFVLVRNGGKGCLHRGGGDETRRTQHARAEAPRAEAAEPNGTERDAGTEGGAETPTDRPHQETHSLTNSRLVWGMETTPLRLRF